MFQNMLETVVLLSGHLAGAFFLQEQIILNLLTWSAFKQVNFCPTLDFWITGVELIKVVRMDHTGHVGFFGTK